MVHFGFVVVLGGAGVVVVGGGGGGGQLLHDNLQLTIMYSGRLSHSPALAHKGQLSFRSVQSASSSAGVVGSWGMGVVTISYANSCTATFLQAGFQILSMGMSHLAGPGFPVGSVLFGLHLGFHIASNGLSQGGGVVEAGMVVVPFVSSGAGLVMDPGASVGAAGSSVVATSTPSSGEGSYVSLTSFCSQFSFPSRHLACSFFFFLQSGFHSRSVPLLQSDTDAGSQSPSSG